MFAHAQGKFVRPLGVEWRGIDLGPIVLLRRSPSSKKRAMGATDADADLLFALRRFFHSRACVVAVCIHFCN